MKRLLIGVAIAGLACVAFAASATAAAFPQLWTDSTKTVPLRSVATTPANQPDALELNGQMSFPSGLRPAGEPLVRCNEVELGTTVVVNTGAVETKLARPFGVAEGDNCRREREGSPVGPVTPTYFDTTAGGSVPASITIPAGGPPFNVVIHKLRLSFDREGVFCRVTLEGVPGALENATEGFVEEAPPNLSMIFNGPPVSTVCGKAKEVGPFGGIFFLETMSTTTDTAFVG